MAIRDGGEARVLSRVEVLRETGVILGGGINQQPVTGRDPRAQWPKNPPKPLSARIPDQGLSLTGPHQSSQWRP